jgi:short-subunit dehydrogenase
LSLESGRRRHGHPPRRTGLPQPRPGSVALVTGASSGIGEAFARALAARGHDLAVVARRRGRLDSLAASLGGDGVRVHVLAADLRAPSEVRSVLGRLADRRLSVQVLVNNAGFGVWGRFHEQDLDLQLDQLRVHAEASVLLTHGLAGAMADRGEGAIVNVASSAALQPVPYLAVYSATKAFLTSFTEAIDAELRPRGVSVLAVHPGAVATEFGRVSGVDPEGEPGPVISARRVADESLRALERGRRSLVPDWRMRAMLRGSRLLPRGLRMAVTERAYRPPGLEREEPQCAG